MEVVSITGNWTKVWQKLSVQLLQLLSRSTVEKQALAWDASD
jgi:hypothetical protein